ncbi:MAG: 23S rRNA (uracil(1939)-C(5))-methyltransferase RlmD [Oscillospiraceae bacterium]|nr:23S rRNA (uracil(1939)-C(5))-methyltransferase RlmD [Oscillospiraceae bacterium]
MEALKKNQVIELEITGVTSEGSGVGHFSGMAVFVSGAASGDRLECVIIKAKKNYAIGKIQKILTPSEDRTPSDCVVFPRCGGCVFRHISYEAELRYKEQRVKDAFSRIGHIDTAFEPIEGSVSFNGYRNKAQYAVQSQNGRLLTGFYAPFSHRVINCPGCLLQPPEFGGILKTISRWAEKYKISAYDEKNRSGLLRHIYIRKGFGTGEIMVCLVINGERIFKKDQLLRALLNENNNIKTVLLNHNTADTNVILGTENSVIFGQGYIEDILCGKRFKLSPLSFYQVNHDGAERLYKKAAELALTNKTNTVVDLYCGTGTIGLTLADKVQKLIGVEIVPDAVKDAEINAKLNGIKNAEFICADASLAAEKLKERGVKPDAVILDPPRKGCDEKLLKTVAEMEPQRIVYVSCDPATLSRDCAVLQKLGYKAETAKPFDMFPRTAHVETVVLLVRKTQHIFEPLAAERLSTEK